MPIATTTDDRRHYRVEVCASCPLRAPAALAVVPLLDVDRYGLTQRELEVVQLVPTGRSSAEIAKQLWVAEKTVKARLTSVYSKLGLGNRTALAVWAVRNGLA